MQLRLSRRRCWPSIDGNGARLSQKERFHAACGNELPPNPHDSSLKHLSSGVRISNRNTLVLAPSREAGCARTTRPIDPKLPYTLSARPPATEMGSSRYPNIASSSSRSIGSLGPRAGHRCPEMVHLRVWMSVLLSMTKVMTRVDFYSPSNLAYQPSWALQVATSPGL